MMSRCRVRFLVVLASLCVVVAVAHAIYDHREATTKPPNRRESVLPWYPLDKIDSSGDPSRSPKWMPPDDPRKPYAVNGGTKTRSFSTRKRHDSETQQKTVMEDSQRTTNTAEQHGDRSLDYSQFEQSQNQNFPSIPDAFDDEQQKETKDSKGHDSQTGIATDDQDFYEGIPADSTKPRKEKIVISTQTRSVVARYDPKLGVQCPEFDSTGQFVYLPNCKFFVNCWKGRAFVQPCAPGTLFNPDTLECDFPQKVKCYDEEASNGHWDSAGRQESLLISSHQSYQEKEPRCPPQLTGYLPHPSECTKFLQCAHGGTHIMDCAPGTVFNPAISNCDWPYKVKGCEDALKSKEETTTPLVPLEWDSYGKLQHHGRENQPAKKVACPEGHTGLLPHPDTCKKFLQCTNGGTFIMDCGPGTAFNPSISVCDWPYNVPGCREDKPQHRQQPVTATTTFKPWSSHGSTNARPWQHANQFNHTSQGHYRPGSVSRYPVYPVTTTARPGTDWDSLRPTWKPQWNLGTSTTLMPSYQGQYHSNVHHGNSDRQHASRDYGEWDSTQGQVYPGSGSRPQSRDRNPPHGNRYDHHHRYHHGNGETQQPAPPYPQQPGQDTSNWQLNYHHHDVHYTPVTVPNYNWGPQQPGRQTQRIPLQQTTDRTGTWRPSNGNTGLGDGSGTQNGSIQHVPPYWPQLGTIYPGYSQPGYGHVPIPDGNLYIDQNYTLPWQIDTQVVHNTPIPTDPAPTGSRHNSDSWSQQESGKVQTQTQRWNQGPANQNGKFPEWGHGTNIYQGTVNREADSKLNQWQSNTNTFPEQQKGERQSGMKGASPNGSKPTYPNGIYANANGTRGHFITKGIEISQGHSKTETYRPNDLRGPNESDRNGQNIYIDSQVTNIDHIPAMVLEPPLITPNDRLPGSSYVTRNKNISSNGRRNPKQFSTADSSSPPGDLATSNTNYNRVAVPSLTLQPPYPSLNEPQIRPSLNKPLSRPPSTNSPRGNNNHPQPPSIYLQPPYEHPIFQNGSHDPAVPAIELPPILVEPSRCSEGSTNFPNSQPIGNCQPPNPPLTLTPNVTGQSPKVRQSTAPPYRGFSDSIDDSSGGSSTTQRISEDHASVPPTVPPEEKPEDEALTTTNPDVPAARTEDENFVTTEESTTIDPNLDAVVLDDKQAWKPLLVFDNKTETTTESSHIMKITNKKKKKKNAEDLLDTEVPIEREEPEFPTSYVPTVKPIGSENTGLPTPISGQVVRLRGGSGPHEGYVEVQGANPGWGIVCDAKNGWSLKEAHVVCKQLGYVRGAETAWQGRNVQNEASTWIAANSVSCQGNETKFQHCKFTAAQTCHVERDAIGVRCLSNRVALCRKDEIPYDGYCYHLADPESAVTYEKALKYCSQRQATLIDIANQAENNFISEWLLQTHPEVASVVTSGVGFPLMGNTVWAWGESSHAKFRFTKWWPGWKEGEEHTPRVDKSHLCIVMKREFPCHERPGSTCDADYFFWDTEDCDSFGKDHSFVCKRSYDDIGCVYGKGGQYSGTANVTASGKDCLSWGDPEVAYPLSLHVLNREVREKLKAHNYCRNLNPNKASAPWCFTGPRGEREPCDLPPCGNIGLLRSSESSKCKPKHFECSPGECIPNTWVCDGEPDCVDGQDERSCAMLISLFQRYPRKKLEGHEVQKWVNTPLKACALRCKDAEFVCRSFAHDAKGNVCYLSDSNVGMTGSLKANDRFDYYEMKERRVDCRGMFVCENRKCINRTQVCDGKNDCNDRSDEKICTVQYLDYDVRLAGSNNSYEGRLEVKHLGVWGQVCDDGFGLIDADVVCKELGFRYGALEVAPGGHFGNMDPPTRFMVDELRCRGNETSLRECDFQGWGVHDCKPEEAVGVICRTAVDTCPDRQWKCDNSPMCIPTNFICDEVKDCLDGSDESSEHCDAPFKVRLVNGSSPFEGRVEVRHHGIWGTVCDDDFSNTTAAVICRSLGYGGNAIARKDGFFGPGTGPIWLDEVFCHGNESQLNRCKHNHWGVHNCNHDEDAGVICAPGDVKPYWEAVPELPKVNLKDVLPANCGRRSIDAKEDDFVIQKVVRGTVAPKGSYPWQASIRVRGHTMSSHWCGAVILSRLHVLTAAHCLEGYNKGTYFVRAGDYNTEIDEGTEADANIEDYYVHEGFRQGHQLNNDIALVLLKGKGIALSKDIVPICLPDAEIEYPAGLNCTISGFGSINTGTSAHSHNLRYGWIPLLDQSECRAEHVYGERSISDGMICAGDLDGGLDSCEGDSGGPLACLNNGAFTLYGITSWGHHCGKPNKPGVYVRVSHYREWIDRKLKESLGGR